MTKNLAGWTLALVFAVVASGCFATARPYYPGGVYYATPAPVYYQQQTYVAPAPTYYRPYYYQSAPPVIYQQRPYGGGWGGGYHYAPAPSRPMIMNQGGAAPVQVAPHGGSMSGTVHVR